MTDIIEFLEKAEPKFKNAPSEIVFEKEQSFALQVLRRNQTLNNTALKNPLSLLEAMSNIASIGLSLNPAKKQAYLVPRDGMVCFDPSYMGLCDLATGSGAIKFVQAKEVCENDEYENRGIDKKPKHKYKAFKDRGPVEGFYCVAKTAEGDYLTTEMQKSEIEDIKNRSPMGKKDSGPWATDYNEMGKKTVVKRASKLWPKTESLERLQLAIDASNQNDGFEPLVTSPELSSYSDDQKIFFDQLITESNAIGMFIFKQTIPEGVYISLYNSFDKDITKYKKLIDELEKQGYAKLQECKEAIEEGAQNEDIGAVGEIVAFLEGEAIDWLNENVSDEARKMIAEYSARENA